ncbi:glycosyltransferase family 2 protein [Ferroacidibacillus organovorans]|uniref:Glycosyltransferase 2-like domain-containing protein n=1 Tax=Ferroacidibacillus organovorans TaxID=1765683 RepID=A0A101XRN2_9BACL|nr:glycosyltransferase family 2 protein [Ferroacidibacillus organovorans]KUO96280.1 hypothetical protein ATW55_03460 [Ferroacidibacillus organovorans]
MLIDAHLDLHDQRDPWSLVERFQSVLKEIKDPWVFWSTELRPTSSMAPVALPEDSSDCAILIRGQKKSTDASWLDYFSEKKGIPCIWKTAELLNWFAAIHDMPPDLQYLPYHIAMAFSTAHSQALCVTPVSSVSSVTSHTFRPTAKELRFVLENSGDVVPCVQWQIKPIISVVICAFNESARIGWAIRSVLLQTFHAWELLVVDDGSTDQTEQIVRSYTDERICLIKSKENKGKSHALNCALENVKGHFFLELDADDWLVPDALETLYRASSILQPMRLLSAHYYVWQSSTRGQLRYRGIHGQDPVRISPEFARVPIPRFYRTDDLQSIGGWMTSDQYGGRLFEDVFMSDQYARRGIIQVLEKPLYHRVIHRGSVSQVHAKEYRVWWNSVMDVRH